MDGESWLSGKAARSFGHTQVEVTTPVEGWRNVSLVILSDWLTKTEFTFKRENRQTKVCLEQHGLFHYNINIETPYSGYEKVVIASRKTGNVIRLQVTKNDVMISEISVEAEGQVGSRGLGGSTGSLKVRWDSSQDIHIYVNTSFDGIKGIFSADTSFDEVKTILVEVGVIKSGFNRKFKAIAQLNDKFVKYESLSAWTQTKIMSKSLTKTNIEWLAFNRSETHLSILYTADLASPIELRSETKTDGITTFDVISSLKVDFQGGEVKLVYKGDFPCKEGKVNALLHVKADLETRFEVAGKWGEHNFRLKMLLGGSDVEARMESSFANLENLKGEAHWTIGQGPTDQYGVNVTFSTCQGGDCEDALTFNTLFDTKPYKEITASLFVRDLLNETFVAMCQKDAAEYSLVATYDGLKRLRVNASLDIPKKSVDIIINNISDGRNWKLKTNAEIDIKSVKSIVVDVQLIVRTPFSDDFAAKVIVDFISPMKEFELAFRYGAIDASLKTNVFWSFGETDILLEVSCPPLHLETLVIEAKRKGFREIIYRLVFNDRHVEFISKNAVNATDFSVDMHLKWPVESYEEIRFKARGRSGDRQSESGEASLDISGSSASASYSRDDLDITLDIATPIALVSHVMVKTNIEKCKNYDIEIVWNTSKVRLKHAIDCTSLVSKIVYESDFAFLESLTLDFVPKGGGDFGVILKFVGLGLHLSLTGDAKSLTGSANGKHFSWKVISDGEQFLADMSYTLEDNSKQVNMTYVWADSQTIGINAVLNTLSPETAEFVLEFTSPFENMEYVSFDASMSNDVALEGSMRIEFNQEVITVQLGSSGDHVFLEVDTPIPHHERLKVDINHHSGNVKALVLYGGHRVDASFVKKNTIYHFETTSKLSNSTYRFAGKIDVEGKSLTTLVVWDTQKIKMKANSNGKSMSVSITSQLSNLRNIKIRGDWKWISGGFAISATSDLRMKPGSVNNEFHAQFVRSENQTSGFWLVRSAGDEIRFEMNVDKSPRQMGVTVSVHLPDMEPLKCHVFYTIENSLIGGAVNVESPWQDVIIEFRGGYTSSKEFEIMANLEAPQPVFHIATTMKMASINDIEFEIVCEVPSMRKSFGAQLVFRPRSLQDFEFFVTLTLDKQKFGGGAAFKLGGLKVDAQISVYTPVVSGDYKMGGEYTSTPSAGTLSLYFNQATWNLSFDANTGNFSAKSKFDLSQFLTSILGSIIETDIPVIKEVEFEVEYKYMESAKILARVQDRGKIGFNFSMMSRKILGHLEVNIIHLHVAKVANFVFDYSENGRLEVSVGDNGDWLELEVVGDDPGVYRGPRSVRAAIISEDQGAMEIQYEKAKSKGVFVLTTKSGIHRVSYDVKRRHGYEITLVMESPYLDNGTASMKLVFDDERGKYEGHFSLNNDHFLTGILYIEETGLVSKLQVDSILLQEKLELKVRYNWENKKFTSLIEFKFKSTHKVVVEYDQLKQEFYISVETRFLPCNLLTLHIDLDTVASPKNGKIIIGYGEESIELVGSLNLKSLLELQGQFGFSASQFTLYKATLKFSFIFKHKKEFCLNLTTTNPNVSKISYKIEIAEEKDNHVISSSLRLPFSGHEQYYVEVRTARSGNWWTRLVDAQFSSPQGHHTLQLSWVITQVEVLFKLRLQGPESWRKHLIYSMSWKDNLNLFCSTDLLSGDKLRIEIVSSDEVTSWKNLVTGSINSGIQESTFSLHYNLLDGGDLVVEAKTPFTDFEHQRVALGFANSEKKMLKGHLTLWGKSHGAELEYLWLSASELTILFKIDIPRWTALTIEARNDKKGSQTDLGAELRVNKNRIRMHAVKHGEDIDAVIKINNNRVHVIKKANGGQHILLEAAYLSFEAKILYQEKKHAEELLTTEGLVVVNGMEKIVFFKNQFLHSTNLTIQDIGRPYRFGVGLVDDISSPDHLSADIQLLFCTDTAQPLSTSFLTGISMDKRTNGADMKVKTRLPDYLGYPAIAARAAFEHVGNTRMTILHLYRGEQEFGTYQRILSHDMFFLVSPREWKLDVTLGLPWQVFCMSRHIEEDSSSASLLWGQNKNSMSGLGVLLHRYILSSSFGLLLNPSLRDEMETRLVVSRLVGDRLGDDSITMLAREERGTKVFHLRTSNPRLDHQLALKVASSSSLM